MVSIFYYFFVCNCKPAINIDNPNVKDVKRIIKEKTYGEEESSITVLPADVFNYIANFPNVETWSLFCTTNYSNEKHYFFDIKIKSTTESSFKMDAKSFEEMIGKIKELENKTLSTLR
jgi:hypothetical protein